MSDSSAVTGALVIIKGSSTSTDINGYYKSRSYSTRQGDLFELHIIVTDVDGENNGVFVSRDTLLSVEGSEHIQDITFEINFYVEMVEEYTEHLHAPVRGHLVL